jgi:hypothetical protein
VRYERGRSVGTLSYAISINLYFNIVDMTIMGIVGAHGVRKDEAIFIGFCFERLLMQDLTTHRYYLITANLRFCIFLAADKLHIMPISLPPLAKIAADGRGYFAT